MMRNEDVADARHRNTRERELPRDAVAAIDDVSAGADHDRIRRSRAGGFRRWPAGRAEQDESRVGLRGVSGCRGCEDQTGQRGLDERAA
jgi:hypothetical protein